jgi:hypothetical protein
MLVQLRGSSSSGNSSCGPLQCIHLRQTLLMVAVTAEQPVNPSVRCLGRDGRVRKEVAPPCCSGSGQGCQQWTAEVEGWYHPLI